MLLEASEHATVFFALDTAVCCLLNGQCSVRLVATLLQVSRRFRRQVWDWFRNPCNYCAPRGANWLIAFFDELWHYKDNHLFVGDVRNMHPLFVKRSETSLAVAGSLPCKMRVARLITYSLPFAQYIVISPWFLITFDDLKSGGPAYDCDQVAASDMFQWYLVADAICSAFDQMIVCNARNKWDPKRPTCDQDKDLFMCAL